MIRRLKIESTSEFAKKNRLAAILHIGLDGLVPLVSIILPTCDRPELLSRAVDSVLCQTIREFELLIVDNNKSTAPVRAMEGARAWLGDPRIQVIAHNEGRNAASARNVGLDIARGDWIAYLDDDDTYRPERLAKQIAAAEKSPVSLCGGVVHLQKRTRQVQVSVSSYEGDALLNEARWGTLLLMHRQAPGLRFDEELFAIEDLHFSQSLLAMFNIRRVPVAPEPLVDIYQDRLDINRTNIRAEAGWRASRRILFQFGPRYSYDARRLFLLRALIARAKLEGKPFRCAALSPALLRAGGTNQIRYALNALLVASRLGRGRWVT
jgi:glycosyltransferase involved in cell wall biosynthesis